MTQEEKDILIKDLSARLPYGVKIQYEGWNEETEEYTNVIDVLYSLNVDDWITVSKLDEELYVEGIKPYLFPLSSMTEEQKNDCPFGETILNIIKSNIGYGIIEIPWKLSYLFINWCNKNHFDYRGLISMGLAIDATGLNIY